MAVLVTDGNQRSTLALTRALGSRGIEVTVGESEPSLACASRWCSRQVLYPSPLRDPAGFQEFLRAELASGRYRVCLPMTDVTTQLAACVRDRSQLPVSLPIPSTESIRRCQDKREVLLAARSLGIDIPMTYMLEDDERIEGLASRASYPAVIKSRLSRWLAGEQWVQGSVEYAATPEELIARYRASDRLIPQPLVQEKLRGDGKGVFLLVWNGELKAAFGHRRLREKPPSGGVSVLRESVPLDPEIVDRSFALLKALDWQGVAMVEFKTDDRDGRLKLMEVNGRFWGSLQLAIDAGMNFPLMLYRLAVGESVPPSFEYRTGVRSRWWLGDLDNLLIRMKRLSNGDSRLRALGDFFAPAGHECYSEVYWPTDPAPGWFELKHWLRELAKSSHKEDARAH